MTRWVIGILAAGIALISGSRIVAYLLDRYHRRHLERTKKFGELLDQYMDEDGEKHD